MIEIFTGRNQFDDDIADYEDDDIVRKKKLGSHVPIFSSFLRVSSSESECTDDEWDNDVTILLNNIDFDVREECQLEDDVLKDAIEAIEDFHDATTGNNGVVSLDDVGGLYVEMSYYVEGGNAPECEPITLLSEHHTIFVNQDDGDTTFRTDVQPFWLPGRHDLENSESHLDQENALKESRMRHRQISKYGSVPLPFDPSVELTLSPPGTRSLDHIWHEGTHHGENPFEYDSIEECSIIVQLGFSSGEDYDCHFANLVVPSLLSLWNDSVKQKKRAAFR